MDAQDGPLPGTLLVQLSRLHRSEHARLSVPEAVTDGPREG